MPLTMRPALALRAVSAGMCARCASKARYASTLPARPSPRAAAQPRAAPRRLFSSTPQRSSDSAPQTHYELFPQTLPSGPPPAGAFAIDTRALRREFLQLQAKYHPDMAPPGPAKARAEAASATINEAYKTLSSPLLRAQYLLALRGHDVANDESVQITDPGLLGLVLEAREEIDEAESEEELEGPREENDERIRRSEEVLEKAFKEDDVLAAKEEAMKLRYWVNVKDSLDGWEKGKPVVLQH